MSHNCTEAQDPVYMGGTIQCIDAVERCAAKYPHLGINPIWLIDPVTKLCVLSPSPTPTPSSTPFPSGTARPSPTTTSNCGPNKMEICVTPMYGQLNCICVNTTDPNGDNYTNDGRSSRNGANCSNAVSCFFTDTLPYALICISVLVLIVGGIAYCLKSKFCPNARCCCCFSFLCSSICKKDGKSCRKKQRDTPFTMTLTENELLEAVGGPHLNTSRRNRGYPNERSIYDTALERNRFENKSNLRGKGSVRYPDDLLGSVSIENSHSSEGAGITNHRDRHFNKGYGIYSPSALGYNTGEGRKIDHANFSNVYANEEESYYPEADIHDYVIHTQGYLPQIGTNPDDFEKYHRRRKELLQSSCSSNEMSRSFAKRSDFAREKDYNNSFNYHGTYNPIGSSKNERHKHVMDNPGLTEELPPSNTYSRTLPSGNNLLLRGTRRKANDESRGEMMSMGGRSRSRNVLSKSMTMRDSIQSSLSPNMNRSMAQIQPLRSKMIIHETEEKEEKLKYEGKVFSKRNYRNNDNDDAVSQTGQNDELKRETSHTSQRQRNVISSENVNAKMDEPENSKTKPKIWRMNPLHVLSSRESEDGEESDGNEISTTLPNMIKTRGRDINTIGTYIPPMSLQTNRSLSHPLSTTETKLTDTSTAKESNGYYRMKLIGGKDRSLSADEGGSKQRYINNVQKFEEGCQRTQKQENSMNAELRRMAGRSFKTKPSPHNHNNNRNSEGILDDSIYSYTLPQRPEKIGLDDSTIFWQDCNFTNSNMLNTMSIEVHVTGPDSSGTNKMTTQKAVTDHIPETPRDLGLPV